MTRPACGTCATPGGVRDGRPWCDTCRIWLVLHEPTGQWVSYADNASRDRAAETARRVAASARQVTDNLPRVHTMLPEGWTARPHQGIDGALYAIAIDAPGGVIDATAYLHPPTDTSGWQVTVHNRVTGVGFPSYTDGGARAASFDTVEAAATDGIRLLRGEIHDLASRRPR
ncbi:hypothetical protein [Micromonospora sediminimaris]|uniref:Uncharacterized protein n=1 Tax=Micromonospora sediminimaris TaxID=547162 RepID=A0A9W5XLH5_9ACTN|nr:hypothetical protein [Micromonospora sediminimaris]GIJ34984.1 hypothetical protein Vse01_41320 [Micromonospora sediminimaris]SFD28989.1 hypothetical protein SAMN05216284_114103 [Micromonospora sediminimaris]